MLSGEKGVSYFAEILLILETKYGGDSLEFFK